MTHDRIPGTSGTPGSPPVRSTAPDPGPPDAWMLEQHARYVHRLHVRRRIAVPLSLLTVVATGVVTVVTLTTDLEWTWWVLAGALLLLSLFGAFASEQPDDGREREVPDTPLEAACVVGFDILSWGDACASGKHDVRVIARPLGDASGPLVHGLQRYPTHSVCPVEPGMLVGFRRYPGLKHLVRIEPEHDPRTLMALRAAAESVLGEARSLAPQAEDGLPDDVPSARTDPGSGPHRPTARSTPRPAPPVSHLEPVEPASVVSLSVGARRHGDFWQTTVTVHTEDGQALTETRYRLPEELAQFEAGRAVTIVRDRTTSSGPAPTTCVIVPRAL